MRFRNFFRGMYQTYRITRLYPSSETQGQLVGTKEFSWAKVYCNSKLSPTKIPSSRLAAPGSPRMDCIEHILILNHVIHLLIASYKKAMMTSKKGRQFLLK